MTEFAQQLGKFRRACNDPDRPGRRLSQERLGELIGFELGDRGFTGAAVSEWERGSSKIQADPRSVLFCLVKVLHKCDGLRTPAEANEFLESGNYRALNADETKEIFQETLPDLSAPLVSVEQTQSSPNLQSIIGTIFFESPQEFQTVLEQEKEGPPPAWPRVMVAVFRRFSDRLSASRVLKFALWVWVWLLAWMLTMPSLRWPFSNRDEALLAVVMYAVGSMIIPALIGVLTNTRDNEFWQGKKSVKESNLRLYTHQGASVGFHVGYFFIFTIALLGYNLGFAPALWLELAAMIFPIFLGHASARLIPYNLFLAYKQLSLRDRAIFFVFFLFGPAWGYFFLESYDLLLTRALGVFMFLLAFTILAGQMAWQNRRKNRTSENENREAEE